MPKITVQQITRVGVIAALYAVLTIVLVPFSFGALQVRVAEGLTLLPMLYPEAVAALFIGCLVANAAGPFGLVDVIGGSLVTLLAAYVTYRFRHSFIAYLSPVLLNAFLISIYVSLAAGWPYWLTVLSIGAGQAVAVLVIGYPLIRFLREIRR
jgi:uncharacterized membrane protein